LEDIVKKYFFLIKLLSAFPVFLFHAVIYKTKYAGHFSPITFSESYYLYALKDFLLFVGIVSYFVRISIPDTIAPKPSPEAIGPAPWGD
jgi:hypothetical protein